MIKIYENELKEIKEKMEKVEKFAEKVPLFKEKILKNKYTGYEQYIQFGNSYKDIYLAWGINRNHYVSGSRCHIFNYEKSDNYDEYLFNIYVNSCDLFGKVYDGVHSSLDDIKNKCHVFFYDKYSCTFYIKDKYIEEFLNVLNEWYLQEEKNIEYYKRQERINKLKQELADLEEEK